MGKVNYVLKSLLDKGMVKLSNFRRNRARINSYTYLLTPSGIEEKSRLAVRFIIRHLNEYDRVRQILTDKLASIRREGHKRAVIVGPEIIRDFLVSIIREKHEGIAVVGQCRNWKDLNGFDPDQYDLALLFDDREEDKKTVSESTGIPQEKLVLLW